MSATECLPDLTGRTMAGIPAYNTSKHIADVVERALKVVDHVVVVDDGSTDDTAGIARAAGATVVVHPENRGVGGALRTLFEYAAASGTEVLVTVDGDGQHDPSDIPAVMTPVLHGVARLVIGSRFLEPGDSQRVVSMPRYRRFGIQVITLLFNLASGCRVTDSQCGLRAYGREAIRKLVPQSKGMEWSVELLVQARAKGLHMVEVPVSCVYHQDGSTFHPVPHGIRVALAVVRMRSVAILHRWTARCGVRSGATSDTVGIPGEKHAET